MRNRAPFYMMALIASVAACLAYNYFTQLELPTIDARLKLHSQIIHGQAPSPYNYRVLIPWITEAFAVTASSGMKIDYKQAWLLAYAGYDFFSLALFLMTLLIMLRIWYSASLSAAGVFFCAALLPLSLRDHYFQPWSLIEAWFFCFAFLLSYHKRFSLLIILTAVAALNRVTSIFIPAVYFLGTFQLRWIREQSYRELLEVVLKSVTLLLLAVAVIMSVRHLQGHVDHVHTVDYLWQRNIKLMALVRSVMHWALFLGAGWFFVFQGWKHSDEFLRNQSLIIPLYLVPVIIFGVWHEVRLLLPLYPILIALILKPIEKEIAQSDGRRLTQ
jgi:hypothetical protein